MSASRLINLLDEVEEIFQESLDLITEVVENQAEKAARKGTGIKINSFLNNSLRERVARISEEDRDLADRCNRCIRQLFAGLAVKNN